MDTNTIRAVQDADCPMMRLDVAAHLARYKEQSRAHTASDLNAYLRWCLERDVMPHCRGCCSPLPFHGMTNARLQRVGRS
ncbi:hypothetical protein [Nocardioides sp. P5_E3]